MTSPAGSNAKANDRRVDTLGVRGRLIELPVAATDSAAASMSSAGRSIDGDLQSPPGCSATTRGRLRANDVRPASRSGRVEAGHRASDATRDARHPIDVLLQASHRQGRSIDRTRTPNVRPLPPDRREVARKYPEAGSDHVALESTDGAARDFHRRFKPIHMNTQENHHGQETAQRAAEIPPR